MLQALFYSILEHLELQYTGEIIPTFAFFPLCSMANFPKHKKSLFGLNLKSG
jgi:hypothetical protein